MAGEVSVGVEVADGVAEWMAEGVRAESAGAAGEAWPGLCCCCFCFCFCLAFLANLEARIHPSESSGDCLF